MPDAGPPITKITGASGTLPLFWKAASALLFWKVASDLAMRSSCETVIGRRVEWNESEIKSCIPSDGRVSKTQRISRKDLKSRDELVARQFFSHYSVVFPLPLSPPLLRQRSCGDTSIHWI